MRQAAAVALIMSLLIGAAVADVYRSVDAQGHVQYSDTPTPGAELVHMQKFGVAGATTSSSAPPASSSAPASAAQAMAKSDAQVKEALAQQAAQRAVQQDVDQSRADQCKKTTAEYDQAVQARRIYRTGADGEREYLSDADADQMRLNLRLAMQSSCGTSQ
ncbi:MAG TPA: DUF4124 domain-containing protein [Steroidobacteraceae bacterium]|nr:DUF4124 domain-containing protein [Steroidobacteraceae bacterium]